MGQNDIETALQTVTVSENINNALRISMIIGISTIIMVFVLSIVLVFVVKRMRALTDKYNLFMKGSTGMDLESSIVSKYKEIDKIKADLEFITSKLNIACDTLLTSYQKMSIVKYDAFKEMGGKLSFSLALLDDTNNGFIMSSVHTNEGCYTYVKEIIKGESFVVLSNEERTALEEAKNRRNYMMDQLEGGIYEKDSN